MTLTPASCMPICRVRVAIRRDRARSQSLHDGRIESSGPFRPATGQATGESSSSPPVLGRLEPPCGCTYGSTRLPRAPSSGFRASTADT
jgi:hypothetical protein